LLNRPSYHCCLLWIYIFAHWCSL